MTCHYPFPEKWVDGEAICLAVAGARFTGKSVFIAVMVKELAEMVVEMGYCLSTVETLLTSGREHYKTKYEEQLLKARNMLTPTLTAAVGDPFDRHPLILNLGIPARNRKGSVYLVIRDVAGEDLEATGDAPHLRFYQNASMVLFMFDPTQINEVQAELKGLVGAMNTEGAPAKEVIDKVLRLSSGGNVMLGVAFSKFDTLQEIGARNIATPRGQKLAPAGAAFNREPEMLGTNAPRTMYDDVDGGLLSAEVRSMLMDLGAKELVNQLERPSSGAPIDHRFFALSALGAPSENNQVNPRGIAPFRVLDPIKWVLFRHGVVQGMKGE
ncbi:MAG TPA: hypothetical protein PKE40_03690 [Arachnia sp.]|nr:hypothetical protein [Arachnia sp.]HMT85433.1 hypothetical protein [Arachnia sp.]